MYNYRAGMLNQMQNVPREGFNLACETQTLVYLINIRSLLTLKHAKRCFGTSRELSCSPLVSRLSVNIREDSPIAAYPSLHKSTFLAPLATVIYLN
jgi:hypothetical protein